MFFGAATHRKNFFKQALMGSVAAAILAVGAARAAEIEGLISDANANVALQGATVRLDGGTKVTVTDRSGRYEFRDLPPGRYQITVSYVGYRDVQTTVTVAEKGVSDGSVQIGALANQAEEVIITGQRRADQNALQNKRSAGNQKDVVTADDVGKLPDRNAADAVQRVPGVSLVTDQGEGRYVTIRGVSPKLNNITVDGQAIGAPEAKSRQVALDAVPANAMARIEVIKSVTPDMDANAIGGTVNLVTPSAFDHRDFTLYGSADLGYNGKSNAANGDVSFGLGTRLDGADRIGLFVSGNYSNKPYASENQQVGNPWTLNGGIPVPPALELRRYDLTRSLWGTVVNLDSRPDDDSKLYIHGLYNEFKDDERRLATVYDAGSGLKNLNASGADITKGVASRNSRARIAIQRVANVTLGGETTHRALTLDGNVNYNFAQEDRPQNNQWSFNAAGPFTGRLDLTNFFFSVNEDAGAYNPANFKFRSLKRQVENAEQKTYGVAGNVKWDLDIGSASGFVKAGVKYLDRSKIHTLGVSNFASAGAGFTLSAAYTGGPGRYFQGYNFGPAVDTKGIESFFAANPTLFTFNPTTSATQSASGAYDVGETVTAGYGMANFDVGKVNVIGGVRVEQTSGTYKSFNLSAAGLPQVTRKSDYTHALPGLQAKFEWTENLILRAAWTNTIGRPDFGDLAGSTTITPGTPTQIADGNPNLKPFESSNIDLAAEYYLVPTGVLSIGPFYKDIKNPIFSNAVAVSNVTIAGTFINNGIVTQPLNATKGHIAGIELNYQQQLTFLPGALDGLGVQLNYTYTDSSVTVPGREKLPFFNQSRQVGNIAAYYDKDAFEARVAMAFRSRYLDILFGPGQDRYADGRRQVDLRLGYKISDNMKVSFDAQNLTDAASRFFAGAPNLLFENEIYDRTYRIGVSAKY
jgi:TonB-dependent receptor